MSVFPELRVDDDEAPETTEIESLCFNCGENVRRKNIIDVNVFKFECCELSSLN